MGFDQTNQNLEIRARSLDQKIHLDLLAGMLKQYSRMTSDLFRQKTLLQAVFHTLHEGLIVYDMEGKVLDYNRAALHHLGLSADQLQDMPDQIPGWQMIRQDFRKLETDQTPLNLTLKSGKPVYQMILGVDRPDGSRLWFSMTTGLIQSSRKNEPMGVIVSFADITFSRAMENAMKMFNDKLTGILSSVTDPVFILDANDVFVEYFYSKPIETLFVKPEEFLFKSYDKVGLGKKIEKNLKHGLEMMRSGHNEFEFDFEIEIHGEQFFYNAKMSAIRDTVNNYSGVSIITRNITERINYEERLKSEAGTDPLTHAGNRSMILKAVSAEIKRFHRNQDGFSVILFDIDHFKQVNDTYGHAAGDTVLVTLTAIVQTMIRQTDLLARWGGEEFLILLPSTNISVAEKLAQRLRHNISSRLIEGVGYITASFGVAQIRRGEDAAEIIRRSDEAMYVSKRTGRNKVSVSR